MEGKWVVLKVDMLVFSTVVVLAWMMVDLLVKTMVVLMA